MGSPLVGSCKPTAEHTAEPGEWTRVRRKGRRHLNRYEHTALPYSNDDIVGSKLRPSFLSVSDIQREHQRIINQWKTSTCCRQLQEVIASRPSGPTITQAICFGLGSFDSEDGSWESRRRAHVQLAAFLCIVKQLQRNNPQSIRCIFQEPIFNSMDKEFIRGLGYEVVDSPEGFEKVSSSTLVYGIHLYRGVYAQAIDKHPPAVFVGTPQEVWEECHESDSLDWGKLKELDEWCDKVKFPEDVGYTTFSSTTIHWRRRNEV
ncbi:hypothetical protein F5Y06DRAFT_265205 [Hypoxylon sp. FL0890]|nr:hypothetical protein F5Y06DRAFT_265205 [Hypoxylon sp. FL0890]